MVRHLRRVSISSILKHQTAELSGLATKVLSLSLPQIYHCTTFIPAVDSYDSINAPHTGNPSKQAGSAGRLVVRIPIPELPPYCRLVDKPLLRN